jgi:flavin-binding protein dodecin
MKSRSRGLFGTIAIVVFFAFSSIALVGCEPDGPAESAGEEIDEAVDEAEDNLEDAADEVEDEVDDVRDG